MGVKKSIIINAFHEAVSEKRLDEHDEQAKTIETTLSFGSSGERSPPKAWFRLTHHPVDVSPTFFVNKNESPASAAAAAATATVSVAAAAMMA